MTFIACRSKQTRRSAEATSAQSPAIRQSFEQHGRAPSSVAFVDARGSSGNAEDEQTPSAAKRLKWVALPRLTVAAELQLQLLVCGSHGECCT